MELRRRRGFGAGAGERAGAEICQWRRPSCRADLRPCQDRDYRRHDAAGPAARQSGVRRVRRTRPPRLLLSVALQRRRAGAAAACQRLGSRYRADLVHGFRVAVVDDGDRGLAQQAGGGGDPGHSTCRRRFAPRHVRPPVRQLYPGAAFAGPDRFCRLAVPVVLGAAASDVRVVRGRGDTSGRPLRAAAERGAVGGAAFARRRRFRKLGLCGRGDLRAGGLGRGAAGIQSMSRRRSA